MDPYSQDVYDHVLRATEWTESLRDLVTTIVRNQPHPPGQPAQHHHQEGDELGSDHRRPDRDHRLLRQNLPYPGFAHLSGFYASTALIVGLSTFLYILFHRIDWL